MTMHDVVELLTALNVRCSAGPLGVEFSWYFDRDNLDREGRHHYRDSPRALGISGRPWAASIVHV